MTRTPKYKASQMRAARAIRSELIVLGRSRPVTDGDVQSACAARGMPVDHYHELIQYMVKSRVITDVIVRSEHSHVQW